MHVPVLSTSHIKQETLNNLGPEFQVLNMKEGAFVWIGSDAYASAKHAGRTETCNQVDE
jgi:hypothetical protein